MTVWYQVEAAEAIEELKSDAQVGLTHAEAARRLATLGPNALVEMGGRGSLKILWEQLCTAMVVLLVVAALVSLYLGEYKDAAVIAAIVVLNAILGFFQDYRAERALAALKRLATPRVRVVRDGGVTEESARDLVPGDILLLEAGNVVPADGRLIEVANLRAQEAALTGESEAVEKSAGVLSQDELPLGDRRNMVFMGTDIAYGRARAVVTSTGMQTELGNIARMLQTVQREPTPLQKRLAQLGRGLAVAAIALVAIVFLLGLARGESPKLMFLTAMSLAVAAVPEGLPAVATVALAVGARRMLQRRALIRKLPAVETLGSVTVICSDKTGTLTENRMTVTVADLAGDRIELTETLLHGEPVMRVSEMSPLAEKSTGLTLLLAGGVLCNDAMLEFEESGAMRSWGDPTEAALLVAAARLGIDKAQLDTVYRRIDEVPFDSQRKRMTTMHALPSSLPAGLTAIQPMLEASGSGAETAVFSKGAVDSLLDVCDRVWVDDRAAVLVDAWRDRIEGAQNELASRGMRVLGVAFRPPSDVPDSVDADVESKLVFVGMFGMLDPPRPEVPLAVARCRTAGIRPVMITGDHPLTAQHIATSLGISSGGRTMTGGELSRLSAEGLEQSVAEVSVYARVSPQHKLEIVEALQNRGHIVAMTGDGVNDAPALKKADIGVAMGITGTDVSKEASEMVLLDDNFATIVNAIEEGRIVYDNIRKFIKYTLTSNAGEIWVMLLAPFLGMPLPLLPLQILWINLVTDGLPGLALAVEPAERSTMQRPPHPPQENIFGRGMARDILWIGLVMGLLSLLSGYWYWRPAHGDDTYWRTVVFTVLTLSQMGNAMAIRSEQDSLFRIGIYSNKFMLASVSLTFVLQMAVIYVPWFNDLLRTAPLSLSDLVLCVALSTIVFWSVEIAKWYGSRRRGNWQSPPTLAGDSQASPAA